MLVSLVINWRDYIEDSVLDGLSAGLRDDQICGMKGEYGIRPYVVHFLITLSE